VNTNVDFSDFILVKYIANLTSENKKLSLNISASSGAKMIKIRLEMTSQYLFEKCGFI